MCSCMHFKGMSAACLFREQEAHKVTFPWIYRDTIQLNHLAVTDLGFQGEQSQTGLTCAELGVHSVLECSRLSSEEGMDGSSPLTHFIIDVQVLYLSGRNFPFEILLVCRGVVNVPLLAVFKAALDGTLGGLV